MLEPSPQGATHPKHPSNGEHIRRADLRAFGKKRKKTGDSRSIRQPNSSAHLRDEGARSAQRGSQNSSTKLSNRCALSTFLERFIERMTADFAEAGVRHEVTNSSSYSSSLCPIVISKRSWRLRSLVATEDHRRCEAWLPLCSTPFHHGLLADQWWFWLADGLGRHAFAPPPIVANDTTKGTALYVAQVTVADGLAHCCVGCGLLLCSFFHLDCPCWWMFPERSGHERAS